MTNFTQLFDEADKARAYIEITGRLGPSDQLLAFINHDGNLGQEIGLESFDNFSLTTQHELLLSKLDPDALDQMAMEGFRDFIKKYRAALTIAGLFVWPVFVMGIAGYVVNNNDNKKPCAPYSDFSKMQHIYESSFNKIRSLGGNIPTTFEEKDWEKFTSSVEGTNVADDVSRFRESGDVPFSESGWTETNFNAAGKFLNAELNSCKDLEKHIGEKLAAVERYLDGGKTNPSTERVIAKGVRAMIANLKSTGDALHTLDGIVRNASRHFTAKK